MPETAGDGDRGTPVRPLLVSPLRHAGRRLALAGSARRLPPWLVLTAVVAVSCGLRTWAALEIPVPRVIPDEMVYGLVGQSLYHSGSLEILGGPTPFYSFVFPAFVGLPLSLSDLELGFALLKGLQALAMSLAAVAVYLWGRSLVSSRWALTAAALTLALPGLVYSGLVMTEVLFYPVLVLTAWAMARVLERPTLGRQALALTAIAVAVLTRLQALVLLPVFVTAVGLDAAFARSIKTVRRVAPTLSLVVVVVVGWAAWHAAGGGGLGGYEVVAHQSYSFGTTARYVLYQVGALTILTGAFPVGALLLLLGAAMRAGRFSRPRQAFLAVAVAYASWFVLQSGVFASRFVGHLAERYLIGITPLVFLALVVWLDSGLPRGPLSISLAGLAVTAPLVSLPLDQILTQYPPHAPTLAWLYDLRQWTSFATLEGLIYGASGATILVLALLPRRLTAVLPLVLLAALAVASIAASRYAADTARQLEASSLGPDPRWIDHAADGPVSYLYAEGANWVGVWEALFWNRRIRRVYGLNGAKVTGPLPQLPLELLPDGRFAAADHHSVDSEYVLAPLGLVTSVPAYEFVGDMVAYRRLSSSRTGLALWRIDPPLRLSFRTTGLEANGVIYAGGEGRIVAYACRHSVFRIRLLVKEPQTVTILRNGVFYRRLTFHSAAFWRAAIPTVPSPGESTCRLDVRPTGLLAATTFRVTQ